MSAIETTRPLQNSPIAAVAELFALSEGATHALLEPAATSGPVFAHALYAQDHLGGITVVGAGAAPIEGDNGVAEQQAVTRSVHLTAGRMQKGVESAEVGRQP